jgi:uncharacterized membrane protein
MAKAKNHKDKKQESHVNQLNVHPVIEAGVIVVKILVLFTAAIVFFVSLMANAKWYAIGIRTSLAMISVGLLGWVANWILGKWVLKYELNKYEEEQNQEL